MTDETLLALNDRCVALVKRVSELSAENTALSTRLALAEKARDFQRNRADQRVAAYVRLSHQKDELEDRLADTQEERDKYRDMILTTAVSRVSPSPEASPSAPEHVVEMARVKSRLFVRVPHDEADLKHPDIDSDASPREVVPACPRCGNWKDQMYQDGIPTYCSTCESGYEEPAYWQRVSAPEAAPVLCPDCHSHPAAHADDCPRSTR